MLKKVIKENPLSKAIMLSAPDFTGSVFVYGKIKSGKTCAMMSLAQMYHMMKDYKIVDLYGGHRNEHHYWALPSIDLNYWAKIKKILHIDNNQSGPKQFKVNFLYPVFISTTPNKLPHNPPDIKTTFFTIPFKTVESNDIKLVIDNISQQALYLWRECLNHLTNVSSASRLEEIMENLGGVNTSMYKNFIKPLAREGLLQAENCNYNLDVGKEMRDRKCISILCLDYVPEEFKLFIMGWFLNQIKKLLDNNKIKRKNLFLIREASEFFKATIDSVVPERYKYFRLILANYIRYGRRGMHFLLDTQSPAETRGLVEGSQDLTLLGRIAATSKRDRAEIVDSLFGVGVITKAQINQLHTLRPGEFIVIEEGKSAYKKYILKPRSMYWQEGYGNFIDNIWKNYNGKIYQTNEDKKILKLNYNNERKEIDEEKNKEKREKEEEKRNKKERIEQRRKQIQEIKKIKKEEVKRDKEIKNKTEEPKEVKAIPIPIPLSITIEKDLDDLFDIEDF